MALDSERPRKKKRVDSCVIVPHDDATTTLSLPATQKAETLQQKMLKSFAERDEALRAITTCKICFRPLYEPFTNQCGHTYCYSCLCQWFSNAGRSQKTCPDCRMIITKAPAPAYALREVTRELLQRPELLPGDDLVGHKGLQREEAAAVERDRSNHEPSTGGLFKGCFTKHIREPRPAPLHDLEDGVIRCPECAWELEGPHPYCHNCGYDFDSDQGTDDPEGYDELSEAIGTEDELDGDISLDDHDFDESMNAYTDEYSQSFSSRSASSTAPSASGRSLWPHSPQFRGQNDSRHRDLVSDASSGVSNDEGYDYYDNNSDELDGDDEESSSMNDFVVDDEAAEEENGTASERSNSTTREVRSHSIPRRLRYTIIDSDDDELIEHFAGNEASGEVSDGTASVVRGLPLYDMSEYSSCPSPNMASSDQEPAAHVRRRRRGN